MKNKLKNLKEKSKGITLIALVITIIVLLILAGVSIAMLTGENGILTKANEAKTKTERAGAYEQVQVQVLGSMGTDGKVNLDELNENLRKNIPGLTYKGKPITSKSGDGEAEEDENKNRIEELPATVVVDEYKIKIKEDGTVTLIEGITAEELTEDAYGKYVNYGIDINGDGDTTKDWRIFYIKDYDGEGEDAQTNPQTGRRIFIISSDYVGNKCEALTGKKDADGASSDTGDCAQKKSSLMQSSGTAFNSYLEIDCCYYWSSSNIPAYKCVLPQESQNACTFPSLFEFTKYSIKNHISGSSAYDNSKCIASLLCTENWSKFVTTGGEYAIGGPTLEMWVNSWNEKEKNVSNFKKLYAVPKTGDNDYGYYVGTDKSTTSSKVRLNTVGSSQDGTGYYDTLYFPHITTDVGDLDNDQKNEYVSSYWLSSPSAGQFDWLMEIDCDASDIDYNVYSRSSDVRFTSSCLSKF